MAEPIEASKTMTRELPRVSRVSLLSSLTILALLARDGGAFVERCSVSDVFRRNSNLRVPLSIRSAQSPSQEPMGERNNRPRFGFGGLKGASAKDRGTKSNKNKNNSKNKKNGGNWLPTSKAASASSSPLANSYLEGMKSSPSSSSETSKSGVGEILEKISTAGEESLKGIQTSSNELFSKGSDSVSSAASALQNQYQEMVQTGEESLEELQNASSELLAKGTDSISSAATALQDQYQEMARSGEKSLGEFQTASSELFSRKSTSNGKPKGNWLPTSQKKPSSKASPSSFSSSPMSNSYLQTLDKAAEQMIQSSVVNVHDIGRDLQKSLRDFSTSSSELLAKGSDSVSQAASALQKGSMEIWDASVAIDRKIQNRVNAFTGDETYRVGNISKAIVRRIASGEYDLSELTFLFRVLLALGADLSLVTGFVPFKLLVQTLNLGLTLELGEKILTALSVELDKRLNAQDKTRDPKLLPPQDPGRVIPGTVVPDNTAAKTIPARDTASPTLSAISGITGKDDYKVGDLTSAILDKDNPNAIDASILADLEECLAMERALLEKVGTLQRAEAAPAVSGGREAPPAGAKRQ